MNSGPKLSMELIWMVFLELLLLDPPRIYHLKRKRNISTGFDDIAFHGHMPTTQPAATRLVRDVRDWARKYYVLVFASITDNGQSSGGLWIRRFYDLVYIDNAFCSSPLTILGHINVENVTRIAIDATILNDHIGNDGFYSLMDELLTFFSNFQKMVFMAPTRAHPPRNRYRGLRLVEQEESRDQKQLAFSNFYRCGAIGTSVSQSTVLFARSPANTIGSLIRTRLHRSDRLRDALIRGGPYKVILFQRQGMRRPTKNIATGPSGFRNRALSKISARSRPVPISVHELLELIEESAIVTSPTTVSSEVSQILCCQGQHMDYSR